MKQNPEKEEVWKALPGYEALYEVSSFGGVRSVGFYWHDSIRPRRAPVIKAPYLVKGYLLVRLSKAGKKRGAAVHRLVLFAFAGPCPSGMECGHRDGKRTNNHLDNLRWVTKAENMADRDRHGTTVSGNRCWFAKYPHLIQGENNPKSLLNADKVRSIRSIVASGKTVASVARDMNLSEGCVRHVVKRRHWKHIP